MHPESFDRSEEMIQKAKDLFRFDLLHYTRDVEESKALSRAHGPMVIIAASGMMEAGRILHHLAQGASDPRNTILVVGFQAEHTLGRRVVERRPDSTDIRRRCAASCPGRSHRRVQRACRQNRDDDMARTGERQITGPPSNLAGAWRGSGAGRIQGDAHRGWLLRRLSGASHATCFLA